jgi:hypothetical protein
MPSLHVIGTDDPIAKFSELLVGLYAENDKKTVLRHKTTHRFPLPQDKDTYEKMTACMVQFVS